MAVGKGLIKEESLIKITPLAGGMQESLSLVHAHSKHLQDHNSHSKTEKIYLKTLTITSICDTVGIDSLQRCFVLQI